MQIITAGTLTAITGKAANDNSSAVVNAVTEFGDAAGITRPHRFAQFLAQLLHESGAFRYDRELWGPSKAQLRYEGRVDLGNTQPGDGYRFRGRGPIQLTGRANYRAFTAWARRQAPSAPDFEASPDLVLTLPWEGLVPIWFWQSRDLNDYADAGNVEMITRKINGGLNGYVGRLEWLVRTSLVLLGHGRADVRGFQRMHGLTVDGIAGPATRGALHTALTKLPLAA